jgi:sorbitol-specific phosphotransferase system component IIA
LYISKVICNFAELKKQEIINMNACLNNLRSLRLVVMMTVLMWTSATCAFVNETFNVDVIMYKVTSENPTKEVTVHLYDSEMHTCDLVIPATVTHNDIVYSVTSIGASAFLDCSWLTSVTIPASVKTIDNNAFKDCSGLKNLTIPDGLTTIGQRAFRGCSSLDWVIIGKDVTSIKRDAFKDCTGIANVYCHANPSVLTWTDYNCDDFMTDGSTKCHVDPFALNVFNGKWSTGDNSADVHVTFVGDLGVIVIGDLYYIITSESAKEVMVYGAKTKPTGELVIPATIKFDGKDYSVTNIGDEAFKQCTDLTSVTIPDGVTTIGDYAFVDCTGLTSVTIPDGVTSIGDNAFWACSGLTSVTIPDGVTSIGNSAFWACTGLTSVTIPDGVTTIGDYAFSYCSGLTSVTIPDGVTSIGNHAFSYCSGLTSVTIPDGVTSIGNHAFSYCSGLTSVTIPDGVTSIGKNAFWFCTGLTSVTFPDGVTSIGNYAFEDCSGLTSVTIPASMTNIGKDAFYGCKNVADVYCYADPDKLTWNENGCNDFKDDGSTVCHVYNLAAWEAKFKGVVNVQFMKVLAPCDLSFSETEVSVNLGVAFTPPTLNNPHGLAVTYSCSHSEVADIDKNTGTLIIVGTGTAIITAYTKGNDDYASGDAFYLLTVKEPEPGDANNDGKVNADDIKAVVDYIMTGKTVGFNFDNADLNGDKKVNAADLVLLINKVK